MKIKVKCPAKINLTLKVGKVCEVGPLKGFHQIESIMQSVSLCDYLTIVTTQDHNDIIIKGNSTEIPYDDSNLVHAAAELFYKTTGITQGVEVFIEKNIPVCAGLAGGSTDAAGMLYGLNKLNNDLLLRRQLLQLCEKLGSDLNFCLAGGTRLAKGRGEILEELPAQDFKLSLIKPKYLKISAREAYRKFDELTSESDLPNDLEFALLPHYKELQKLHSLGFQMSGSGPTYFVKKEKTGVKFDDNFEVFEGLKTLNHGVICVDD